MPLSVLLHQAQERYHRPMVLSETGHFGSGRAAWLEETVRECVAAILGWCRLEGHLRIAHCRTPRLGRFDTLPPSGVWDLDERKNRIPEPESAETAVNLRANRTLVRSPAQAAGFPGLNFIGSHWLR